MNLAAVSMLPLTGDTGLPGLASLIIALGVVVIIAALAVYIEKKKK